MVRRRAALLSALLMAAAAGQAAVPPLTTNSPAVPPAARIDADALEQATRAVLASATDFLLNRATTNYMQLVVEPSRRKSVQKAYTQNYRKEVYDHPVYQETWEYEEVMVAAQGSAAEHRQLVKTRRPIPGSRKLKLIRTEKRERLVLDPKGSIVHNYPEQVHPEVWQRSFLGQNALALFALLRCGIPEDEPVVKKMTASLSDILERIGIPDTTWDVAWLAAAYANLKAEPVRKLRAALVVKLLEGQITDGPARGLWGPVCINTTLFSSMLAYEQELSKELAKRKELLQLTPDSRKLSAKVNEADASLGKFIAGYKTVTHQGLRFAEITKPWTLPQEVNFEPLMLCGLPYYFYNQALADVECTALALYAAREAARQGVLPEELKRPETASGPILPAEKTSAILARSASALAALQGKDGLWSEGNIHQPLNRFEPLGFGQLKKEEVLPLPSERTFASTAAACTALFDAGGAVGMDKLLARFRANVTAGQQAQRRMAEAYLDGPAGTNSLPLGRYLAPYDFLFSLRGIERALSGPVEDRRDLQQRLAYRILKMQDLEGFWGKGVVPWQSPSLFGYEDATVCKPAHEREFASVPKDKKRPYNTDAYWKRRYIYAGRHVDSLDANVVCTAYAMLFLESGLRGPAAGFLKETDAAAAPGLLANAIFYLGQKDGIPATSVGLSPAAPAPVISALPVLFVHSKQSLAAAGGLLRACLGGRGVVAVEVADAASGQTAEAALAALLPGGAVKAIPPDAAFLANYQGVRPPLRGLFGPGGRLSAVFFPANEIQGAYVLIRRTAGDRFLDPRYPAATNAPDRAVARVAALHRLDETVRTLTPGEPPAVPPTTEPPAAKPPEPAPPPAPVPPKPEDLSLPKPPVIEPKKPAEDEKW